MNLRNISKIILLNFAILLCGCSDNDNGNNGGGDGQSNSPKHPSADLPQGTSTPGQNLKMPGDGVMMQAFYWDVTDGGIWWEILTNKIDSWAENGIDAIWLPPISKGQSGRFSMGYDPTDYFDFGDFEQNGTVETRFGNRSELEVLIERAHSNDIAVIADMVINHNSGGALEFNSFAGMETYTLFNVPSGLFNRNKHDFLPNGERIEDSGRFAGFPDLDLQSEYVQGWFWKSEQSVANFYMNTLGIDGWRFDFVKGFSPSVVKDWVDTMGGFAVGENFDGNLNGVVLPWVEASGLNAFDFPNFFKMRDAFNFKNLNQLSGLSLFETMPQKAVTFVGNHDTENRQDNDLDFPNEFELHAYAYILMAPGYPCIFYSHYENGGEGRKEKIQKLIQVREQLAAGAWSIVHASESEFIARRSGSDTKNGLILYLNISDVDVVREIETPWINEELTDYTENLSTTISTNESGLASVLAPANSYSVWSVVEE